MRRKKWWQKPLWCVLGKHQWAPYDGPRLMVLDESFPPNMIDGLPRDCRRFDCLACGEIKAVL